MTDRNTSQSSSHSNPIFHNSTVWPVIKSRPSFIFDSNPSLYPSPPMTYPMYDENVQPDIRNQSFVWPNNISENKELYESYLDSYRQNNLLDQGSLRRFHNRNTKAHSRFKSAGNYFSEKPSQTPKFLSPPLPSLNLVSTNDNTSKSPFQFQATLHSSVAIMKKENQKPITYLNRGQNYLLEISTPHHQRGTLTSTVSIEFHEPGHRKIAESYWKFWQSQQPDATAICWDENQTTGVFNIRNVRFDKITFDWHGCFDPKVYIRFHCLSTDFSRIKGVKGIPMRVQVETKARYDQLPDTCSMPGILTKNLDKYDYVETCFCQIKLFRDKGAERKNKDDSKQIAKQLEKIKVLTMGNPEQHPLWPVLSQRYLSVTQLTELYIPENSLKRRLSTDSDVSKKQRPNHTFYIWSKRQFIGPKQIQLESLTLDQLKIKLSTILLLDPTRITKVVYNSNNLLTNDNIEECLSDQENIVVDWEVMLDNNIKLILEFERI